MKRIIPFLPYAAVAAIILSCFLLMPDRVSQNEARNTSDMVYAAVMEYYAMNGVYPDTVEELENFGLKYNKARFTIGYINTGGNLMPEITVLDRSVYEK